ncbi:hypothetical protein FACS1894208_10320 [Clostridia bacterium]|nr:hypothetical protein FACS1894208_10320 [Clostridia bacterium]
MIILWYVTGASFLFLGVIQFLSWRKAVKRRKRAEAEKAVNRGK